jgi:hypothetical protein
MTDENLINHALMEIRGWPHPSSFPDRVDFFGNSLTVDAPCFREIHLNEVFSEILPALWHLWEALLVGLPILVVCQGDAARVSRAVLSCVSLLSPWNYQGDFRPYLPIFDGDYKSFAVDPKSCIVGVTSSLAAQQLSNSFSLVLVLDSGGVEIPGKILVVNGGACSLFVSPEVTSKSGGTRPAWNLGSSSDHLRLYCTRDEGICRKGNEHVIRETFRKNTEAVVKAFKGTKGFTEDECMRNLKIPEKLGTVELSPRKFSIFMENVVRGPNLRPWLQTQTY